MARPNLQSLLGAAGREQKVCLPVDQGSFCSASVCALRPTFKRHHLTLGSLPGNGGCGTCGVQCHAGAHPRLAGPREDPAGN